VLYGTVLTTVVALAMVEIVAPSALRTLLDGAVAFGAFAGMAFWGRSSRVAFDLQEWCDCAAETMTVRVIESRRPPVLSPAWVDEAVVPASEQEVEVAHR
jgi:hypothetical protein